ncbi:MAG: hypothetical protein ACTSP6_06550 [Promethearchaeota archaeon]
MSEQKKVGHAQHLKAVNHPIRREMLNFINEVEQISESELLDKLKTKDILDDANMFKYNMDFLIQALCVERIADDNNGTYYKILPGGKVIENF